jgi:hypothetical protein
MRQLGPTPAAALPMAAWMPCTAAPRVGRPIRPGRRPEWSTASTPTPAEAVASLFEAKPSLAEFGHATEHMKDCDALWTALPAARSLKPWREHGGTGSAWAGATTRADPALGTLDPEATDPVTKVFNGRL